MQRDRRWLTAGLGPQRVLNPLPMRLGLVTTRAVRGRRSGRWRTVPVNVLELDGARYLVAARGDTDWVRNPRAAGAGGLRRGRSPIAAGSPPRLHAGSSHDRGRPKTRPPGRRLRATGPAEAAGRAG